MEADGKLSSSQVTGTPELKTPALGEPAGSLHQTVPGERAYSLAEVGLKKSWVSLGSPLHWTLP